MIVVHCWLLTWLLPVHVVVLFVGSFELVRINALLLGSSKGFTHHRRSYHEYKLSRVIPSIGSRRLALRDAVVSTEIEQSLKQQNIKTSIQILSNDPLIYLVPNLLTPAECEAYCNYANSEDNERAMTRSNPPAVSLDMSKLWPLPLLALVAGLPPYLRLIEQNPDSSLQSIAAAVVPNIVVALTAMMALAWLVVLPAVRRMSDSSSRTSVATALNREDDVNFVRSLVDRVSAATAGHPWQCFEAPVITRYDPGAIFARHGDASPTRGSEWRDTGGQRLVTCICYLNTLETGEGGETYFDKLNLSVRPMKGSALIFFPADEKTWQADDRTTHESLPPAAEKWIVQLFGRAERVPPPLGLPDAFGDYSS